MRKLIKSLLKKEKGLSLHKNKIKTSKILKLVFIIY
jgi:hypothetical protein